jgi:hypothetical protein
VSRKRDAWDSLLNMLELWEVTPWGPSPEGICAPLERPGPKRQAVKSALQELERCGPWTVRQIAAMTNLVEAALEARIESERDSRA